MFDLKTCLTSSCVNRYLPDILFDSNSLEFCIKIPMFGVALGPAFLGMTTLLQYIAKVAAYKLGFLFRVRRFSTPNQFLTLYMLYPASTLWLIVEHSPPFPFFINTITPFVLTK